MQKRIKTSKSDKVLKKAKSAPSYIHSLGDNVSNDMWRDTCDATVRKYHTVIPDHHSLLPASPQFLRNYDSINWHREESK